MAQFRFSLRQIEYFLAAAESPTMSEAAVRLNVSTAALSEALRELETDLETQIFVRRKAQGISLTRAGSELAVYARSVFASAEQLVLKARGEAAGLTGRVAVGCYATLAPFILPRLIERLNRDHPGVYVEIVEGSADEIQSQLHDGRCDVAVLYDYDLAPNTIFEELFRLKPRVLLPDGHRLARKKTVDLAALQDERFIQYVVPPAPQSAARIFEEVGVIPRAVHGLRSYELIRAMVARGLGYSLMFHRPNVAVSLEGLGVTAKPITRNRIDFGVVLVRSAHIHPSPRAMKLWEVSKNALAA